MVGWNVMYIMQRLGLLSLFFKGEEKEKENDKETDSYKYHRFLLLYFLIKK